jgi:hypothetical protein
MYVLGVDVAKNKLDVALLLPDREQYRTQTVPNTPEGFAELCEWLGRQKVPDLSQVHLILKPREGTMKQRRSGFLKPAPPSPS